MVNSFFRAALTFVLIFALAVCFAPVLSAATHAPTFHTQTFTPDWVMPAVLAMPAAVAVPTGTFAKLVARFKALLPDKTDAEIQALVAAELTEQDAATPAPPPPPPAPAQPDTGLASLQASLATLQQQVSGLTEALTSEKTARETAQKALADQQAADRTKQIAGVLDDAVKAGRVEAAKRDEWKGRLEKDFDGFKAVLDGLPSQTQGKSAPATPASGGTAPAAPRALAGVRPDAASYLATALAGNATAPTA